jgi:hypothetical protein
MLTQKLNYQRAVEQMLRPLLTKAGLHVEKLDKMAAQNQSELRRIFENNKTEAARHASLEMAAIRKEVQQRARALQNPANLPVLPYTAINLERIFLFGKRMSAASEGRISRRAIAG